MTGTIIIEDDSMSGYIQPNESLKGTVYTTEILVGHIELQDDLTKDISIVID